MSWSMIHFGDYWAHAHDAEQILFMTLASEFLDSSPKFREVPWLQEWKDYWLDHKVHHANGCSNIDLSGFLTSQDRIDRFREFLADYKIWLSTLGDSIPAGVINEKTAVPFYLHFTGPCEVRELVEFACKVDDVLRGNTEAGRAHEVAGK